MKEYIVLVPNNIKNKIIELSRIKYYNYNIKFMSIDTFIKRVTFDFDEKTIYNLMKKYNYNYSTSLVYLDNLNYISNKLSNNKMTKLKEIKDYLDSNKLLIYDNLFKEYVKDKEIYIYGYDYINKYYKSILDNYIEISAKENIGIEKIKDEIKRLFNLGELEASDLTYMSNARSISLLGKSLNNINDAISEINNNSPIDIVEFHLKDAWNNLGEIIGETYTDELLDELFSRFCLGK